MLGLAVTTMVGQSITPGNTWNDTNGSAINAHGGCVVYADGYYYWFGEQRNSNKSDGISCYRSKDLYSWTKLSRAVSPTGTKTDENRDIASGRTLERPKVIYNEKTKKTALYPLEPLSVDIWYDDKKILAEAPMLWYRYTATNRKIVMIPFDCILHVRNFATKDGLKGKSVRDILAETISGNVKAQSLLNKMYDNGFAGKAAIQYTGELSDELEKRFVKGVEKYIKGEYKADGIDMLIPLPYMAKIENLSNIKLADAQFLELKQYSAIQIAAAFGIKPVQIGDYTKSSYAATEAQQLAFLVETLLFILKQYEEEINFKLLDGGCYAKFNTDAMLRMDFKTKVETLSKAIFSGQMTINEARAKDDRQAVDGGDEIILNGSTIFLKDVGIQYQTERG